MRSTKLYSLLMLCLCVLGLRAQSEPERTLVFDMNYEDSRYYRIPALTVTDDGALIAVVDKRGDALGDLPNTISIVSKRSVDNGRTWGETVTVAQGGDGKTYGDPAIVKDKDGNLLCIFAGDQGLWDSNQYLRINFYTSRSTDNGQSWSEPRLISDQIYQSGWYGSFAGSGNALRLKDGRLMFVVATRLTPNAGGDLTNFACYSDDNGETWQVSEPVQGRGDESKVVELEDGRILMSIRNPQKGYRKFAISNDRGQTWEEPTLNMDLMDPACNGDIIRYPSTDGQTRLLHSLPASTTTRENVTVYLSYDEGQTWRVKRQISDGYSAYSSLTVLPDGTIGALVEEGKWDAGLPGDDGFRLWFVRFSLDWLEGGATPEPEPSTGTLRCDGTNRYMRIPNADVLNPRYAEGYTVTCKVKLPRFISGSNMRFVGKRAYEGNDNSTTCGWELYGGNSSSECFSVNMAPLGSPWGNKGHGWSTVSFQEDTWTHLTWIFDGFNATTTIYVDGQRAGHKDLDPIFATTGVIENDYDILVGAGYLNSNGMQAVPAWFMTGEMDDVRFFSKALTQDEVTADMTAEVGEDTPNLIAAYDFENIAGSTVPDISGNGHDGTLVNFPDASQKHTVTINYPDASMGTLRVLDGQTEVHSGMQVSANTLLTVEVTPTDDYTLTAIKVNGTAIEGNTFTLTGDATVTAEFEPAEEAYPYCIPDTHDNNRASWTYARRVKTITIDGGTVNGAPNTFVHTLNNINGQSEVFMDERDEVIRVTQGDRIDFSWTFRDQDVVWVHYYVYIDYDKDGVFNEENELVSYTHYQGSNSLGQTTDPGAAAMSVPLFTIPGDAPAGETCLRFKVDWDSKNPCGNPKFEQEIGRNGGTIVDYTIEIQEGAKYTVTIDEAITGGTLSLRTLTGTPVTSGTEVASGTTLTATATPDDGYRLQEITVNDVVLGGDMFTVTENTTVSAVFTNKLFLSYVFTGEGGMVVSDGETTYPSGSEFEPGTDLTVTLDVPEGSEVVSFTKNGVSVLDDLVDNTYTITDCREDLFFNVRVAKKQFAINFEQPAEGGSMEVRNETTGTKLTSGDKVEYGDELAVTLKPKSVYGVASLLVNGVERKDDLVDDRLSIRVTEALTLSAVFAEQTFVLTWTVEGNGTVVVFDEEDPDTELTSPAEIVKNRYVDVVMTPDGRCVLERLVVDGEDIDLETDPNLYEGIYYIQMEDDMHLDIYFSSLITGVETLSSEAVRYDAKTQTLHMPEGAQAVIYSVNGHKVMELHEATASLTDLSDGYYLVKVTLDGSVKTVKFVK